MCVMAVSRRVSMPTAEAAYLTAACRSGPVGDGDGPHHLHQQDRRLPGVPEPRFVELRDHQRQGFRDEHRRARQRRRVCEYSPQRWGGVFHCGGSFRSWLSGRGRCFSGSISRSSSVLPPQKEHAVPEQFKTIWDGKKLVTTISEMV